MTYKELKAQYPCMSRVSLLNKAKAMNIVLDDIPQPGPKREIKWIDDDDAIDAINTHIDTLVWEEPQPTPKKEKKKKASPKYTPKEKARFAIESNMPEKPKWMQEWIDWSDTSIPIGKRKVAFVRYLTMTKGYTLDAAKRKCQFMCKCRGMFK